MNRSFWTWRVQDPILLAAILLVAFARATGSAALSIVFFVAHLAIWLAAVVSATIASGQITSGASSSFWGLVTIERTSGPQGTSASLSSGPKAQLLWLLPAVGLVIGFVKVGRNSRDEGLAKGAAAPMT